MSHSHQLPPGANLGQLKNQAKDLCRACGEGDPSAIRRVGQSHPKFSGLTQVECTMRLERGKSTWSIFCCVTSPT